MEELPSFKILFGYTNSLLLSYSKIIEQYILDSLFNSPYHEYPDEGLFKKYHNNIELYMSNDNVSLYTIEQEPMENVEHLHRLKEFKVIPDFINKPIEVKNEDIQKYIDISMGKGDIFIFKMMYPSYTYIDYLNTANLEYIIEKKPYIEIGHIIMLKKVASKKVWITSNPYSNYCDEIAKF